MNTQSVENRQSVETDDQLIQRYRSGDDSAFDLLFERYSTKLLRVISTKCWGRIEPVVVAQETWFNVSRRLRDRDWQGNFQAWLFHVAKNCVVNELRKLKTWNETSEMPDDPPVQDEHSGIGRLIGQEEQKALEYCLSESDDGFLAVYNLRKNAMSYKEIAERLDIAPGTVASKLNRGLKELAECVKKELP